MKPGGPASAGVTGRTRVLPNRNTLGVFALLIAMWYAGASQNNGAAYLLGFVLLGVGLVSILHTGANLRGLRFFSGPIPPVFAGERQRVPLSALAASGRAHLAVRIKTHAKGESADLPEVSGTVRARARGQLVRDEIAHEEQRIRGPGIAGSFKPEPARYSDRRIQSQ